MTRIVVFYLVQLMVSAYAIRRGGAPERTVAVLMIIAAAASSVVSVLSAQHYQAVITGLLTIDAALFVALCTVVVFADRFWPIWMAALQLLALAVHGARAYDPAIVPLVYAWSVGQIAYPMLAMLAFGTARHRRREQISGAKPGWRRHERDR